ncbi:hypothetical protein MACH09_26740 [Vibrio sp. MACH09]|uniref:DUF3135 domain-containing protein n=1 Tax=unclassified Vibrio TaxID=2614977 RepID=UPI00149372D3|nr:MULTISPECIES: DUF3135 domain-containing protein [unclassified Vibrio]NOI66240.1 DUF3135 domain-containing protein [Vibrio sp. 99-8-1]GLO62166.1 hypothetical protein MACH09_26740 [Vibrio sp. MACH09]
MENSAVYDPELPSFDELVDLAENDPQEFDRFKLELCEQVITIASVEMQPRLRAQQSHIDRVIKRCKNPYQTNMVLAQELSAQMGKFKVALEGDLDSVQSAEIIPFSPRQTQ